MDKKVKFIDNRDPILEKDDAPHVFDFFSGSANSPPLYPLYESMDYGSLKSIPKQVQNKLIITGGNDEERKRTRTKDLARETPEDQNK